MNLEFSVPGIQDAASVRGIRVLELEFSAPEVPDAASLRGIHEERSTEGATEGAKRPTLSTPESLTAEYPFGGA